VSRAALPGASLRLSGMGFGLGLAVLVLGALGPVLDLLLAGRGGSWVPPGGGSWSLAPVGALALLGCLAASAFDVSEGRRLSRPDRVRGGAFGLLVCWAALVFLAWRIYVQWATFD